MAVNDPSIIQYQSVPVVNRPVEIRREGEDLVVTIAPAAAARLILGHVLSMAAWLAVFAFMGILALLAAREGPALGGILFVAVPAALSLLGLAFGIERLVTILRVARLPATVRASRARLTIDVPTLGRRRHHEWPAPLITDVSLRHAGLFPALVRFIRIQIVLADDRADSVLIPSPGGESLALIEDNIRDALGMTVLPVSTSEGTKSQRPLD